MSEQGWMRVGFFLAALLVGAWFSAVTAPGGWLSYCAWVGATLLTSGVVIFLLAPVRGSDKT
jgi:hypothetical protein